MSPQIAELEKLLSQLVAEHRTLLAGVQRHQEAMRTLRFDDLAAATEAVEGSRTRLVMTESRRRLVVQQITRLFKLPAGASLADIANHGTPVQKKNLLALRDELKLITGQITRKTTVSQKVAGALLGHLNTVVRLVAGAVQGAAVYTKQGMPTVSARIGVMEAVG